MQNSSIVLNIRSCTGKFQEVESFEDSHFKCSTLFGEVAHAQHEEHELVYRLDLVDNNKQMIASKLLCSGEQLSLTLIL
jgi:hypothetical protein